jgi:gamma-glutamylcyclotransferase (GGCT)/AIG2-like uncharacterized protein YtfP
VEVGAEKTILLVYGTLRRGQRNHRLLADQEFVGGAVTAPRYRVFGLGDYPGMVRDEEGGLAVRGELFAVGVLPGGAGRLRGGAKLVRP